MQKSTNIAGVILAGGMSKRMGKNKALIKIGKDTTVLERTIDILKELFEEILLITNSPEEYEVCKKECSIRTDIIKGIGPLGGIYTGLSHTTKENIFCVACDMPFLDKEFIKKEIEHFREIDCEAFVPEDKLGQIEPLHSIYKKELKEKLEAYIKNTSNYSIREFLRTIKTYYWEFPQETNYNKIFMNLNTPEDLKEINENI